MSSPSINGVESVTTHTQELGGPDPSTTRRGWDWLLRRRRLTGESRRHPRMPSVAGSTERDAGRCAEQLVVPNTTHFFAGRMHAFGANRVAPEWTQNHATGDGRGTAEVRQFSINGPHGCNTDR